MPYDICDVCGSQKTGFTALFCPKCEADPPAAPSSNYLYFLHKSSIKPGKSKINVEDECLLFETMARARIRLAVYRTQYSDPEKFYMYAAERELLEPYVEEEEEGIWKLTQALVLSEPKLMGEF